MIRDIVYTILKSSSKSFPLKEDQYANKANIRKRRGQETRNVIQCNSSVDNAKTYKIKRNEMQEKLTLSLKMSILIIYLCTINVIVCDVSVNNVNSKHIRSVYANLNSNEDITKIKPRDLKGKYLEKNVQSETSSEDEDEKTQELNKYFSYYKNKENASNILVYKENKPIVNDIYDDTRAIGYPHDLATNAYYLKRTNFNLRPESHQFDQKIVKLGVLLPADPYQVFSLGKVLPIVEMAVASISKPDGPLPGWQILVDYRDTRCSSVEGPLAAFEFYVNGSADAFIGPGCEYVIAPVARYAGLWHIPVLTAGAQAEAFSYKQPSYMTLTRMMGSYIQAGVAIRKVFEEFNWHKLGMLYHNNDPSSGKGNSPCFLTLSAVFTVLQKKGASNIPNIPFDEMNTTSSKIKELLTKLSLSTRSEYE